MVIQFIDREKELKELKEVLNSKKFELFITYGRRRIGKTELILQATKNKKRVYYLATGENNLDRFHNTCISYNKDIGNLKKDFEIIFDFLKDEAEVIIIDEFQNMIHENKNILNLFQAIVDTKLKDSELKLFLLGSSISMVTSKVMGYKSPLYGRRSGSLNLKAMSFFDIKGFFPGFGAEQLMRIYGFADGIPYYILKIDNEFWPWIGKELSKEKSFLRDEVDFMMKYEFEDVSTYKLILEAIANGKTKLNEIKNFINVKRTDITPYLKNLIEVGFIKRVVPITERAKSRKGRYFISDNFLKFWFRYIYPNLSSIEEGIFNVDVIKRDYSSYLGSVFEEISKQFLIASKPFRFSKIGKWWHKDAEIDIVAIDESNKKVLFAECKFKSKVDAKRVTKELAEKAKFFKWNNSKRRESYAVFAKSFSKKITRWGGMKVYCFDLKEFEKLINK